MKIVHLLLAIVLTITTMTPLGISVQMARAEGLAPAAVTGPAGVDATYLAEELAKYGSVSLIVGLDMPGYDPALFDQVHAAGVQEASIANAQQALLDQLAVYGVTNIQTYEYMPFVALTVTSPEALTALYADPAVTSIEEDAPLPPLLSESLPLIKADQAHNLFYTGAGKTVVILDTGTEKNHPALAGKVVSEACYSTNDSSRGVSSLCPGGVTSSVASNSALPCPSNISGCDHGTHVAAIAAGVAPGASIIAMQVFSRHTDGSGRKPCADYGDTSPCTRANPSDYVAALNRVYALRNTFDIAAVNMSIGGGKYTSTCDSSEPATKTAVDLLRSAGIATIVATGNNGYVNAIAKPACLSNVISVGSINSATFIAPADLMTNHTNISSFTTLLAPGVAIEAAIPASFATDPANPYGRRSGTSMAAPHVAGAVAVLKQVQPGNNSNNVTSIASILAASGPPIADWREGGSITKRRLDLYAAICRIVVCDSDDFRTLSLNQTLNGSISWFGDRDHYSVYGTAGQRVTFRMEARSSTVDPYLELYDPQGKLVAKNDNGGGDLNALINGYLLNQSGRYQVVTYSKTNVSSGAYTISMSSRVEAVNPEPTISGFAPSSATATKTGQDFWVMIGGNNFMPTSQVYWNGQRRSSLYYSPTLLYVRILGSDLNVPLVFTSINALISVTNPAPGGGTTFGFFRIQPAFLGESELVSPESGSVVTTGIKQSFVISWTHPTDSWRTMQNMDLRLRSPEGSTLASIRVVEREGTNSVYRLLNGAGEQLTEEDGETPAEGLGGEDRDLEIPGVLTLHLAGRWGSTTSSSASMAPRARCRTMTCWGSSPSPPPNAPTR
ncbi:MAG: hypothetical protein DCC55_36945 [Chloroflexi bacterium]|nr:MAG: hypothetical protein DCC55_36945 [Chloroflexota bacterium]